MTAITAPSNYKNEQTPTVNHNLKTATPTNMPLFEQPKLKPSATDNTSARHIKDTEREQTRQQLKNTQAFIKGATSPIRALKDPKNLAIAAAGTAATVAVGAIATGAVVIGGAATAPIIATGAALTLAGAGLYFGVKSGITMVKGAIDAHNAKNGKETETAYEKMGEGTSGIVLSALGTKASFGTLTKASSAAKTSLAASEAAGQTRFVKTNFKAVITTPSPQKPAKDIQAFSPPPQIHQEELQSLSKNIPEIIQKPENFLGRGSNGSVYKLPDHPDFVVKIPNHLKPEDLKALSTTEAKHVTNEFPNNNFGQPVAEIGNVQILLKQKGITHGIPQKLGSKITPETDQAYISQLKTLSEMPQNTYDELANSYNVLRKQGYAVDPSKSSNLLIDTQNQKINIVDIAKDQSPKNDFGDMAVPLLETSYYNKKLLFGKMREEQSIIQSYSKIIIEKCLAAAKKTDLPMNTDASTNAAYAMAGLKLQ